MLDEAGEQVMVGARLSDALRNLFGTGLVHLESALTALEVRAEDPMEPPRRVGSPSMMKWLVCENRLRRLPILPESLLRLPLG